MIGANRIDDGQRTEGRRLSTTQRAKLERRNKPARGPSKAIPEARLMNHDEDRGGIRLNSRKRRRNRWHTQQFDFVKLMIRNQDNMQAFITRMKWLGVSAKNATRALQKFAAVAPKIPTATIDEG